MSKSLLQSQLAMHEAVEVAPDKYAYEGDDGWRVATSEAFIRCATDDEYGLDAHSVEMPAWWTPEQRFAWRNPKGEILPDLLSRFESRSEIDRYDFAQRITADLNTGAEIPA